MVEQPERTTGLRSPPDIALRFEAAEDAEVDLDSLAITYRVGFWWTATAASSAYGEMIQSLIVHTGR